MSRRSRLVALSVSVLVVLSMAVGGYARLASAAGTARAAHAPGKHAANAARCAKRNKATGTIKMSDWQFPDTLNPYQSSLLVTRELGNAMFDGQGFPGMYKWSNSVKLVPTLLTRVPTAKNHDFTNGGKTIILHLRHGMRWSNGQEITSADVKFGWRIDMNDATGPACSGSCDVINRIDTPDRYTAILRLKTPYAAAVPNAFPDVWPTSWSPNGWAKNDVATAAKKIGQDSSFNFESVAYPTNGPYQVSQFVMNDRIVMQPMKYYSTMTCGAYIKNLIFAFYSSKPGMIAAAASRATDVTFNYTSADVPDLLKHKSKFTTHVGPSFTFEHVEFNVDKTYKGKPNPLSNTSVRQALALALDKYGLIRSALGLSRAQAQQIIAWTPWVNTPSLVQPFTDKKINGQWDPIVKKYVTPGTAKALSDAQKLLARTPFAGGFTLDGFTTSGNPVRQAQFAVMAASWAKLKVTFVPNYIPTSKLFSSYETGGTFQHGDFQVGMFGFTGPPDPDSLKYNLQSKYIDREQTTHNNNVNGNYSAIHDKIIDRGFDVAARSLSKSVRFKEYDAVQKQMDQQAYWVGLFFRPTIATEDGKVKNFSTNPTTAPQWNAYAWKVGSAS